MDFNDAIRIGFSRAPFIEHLGIKLDGLGPGWCETSLAMQPWQLQQTQVAHAGVVATLADHTAGAAATTQVGDNEYVVTAEYKINFLRGAKGEQLVRRAEVLKPGKRLAVVEAQVWAEANGKRDLVAKFNATMAVIGR